MTWPLRAIFLAWVSVIDRYWRIIKKNHVRPQRAWENIRFTLQIFHVRLRGQGVLHSGASDGCLFCETMKSRDTLCYHISLKPNKWCNELGVVLDVMYSADTLTSVYTSAAPCRVHISPRIAFPIVIPSITQPEWVLQQFLYTDLCPRLGLCQSNGLIIPFKAALHYSKSP